VTELAVEAVDALVDLGTDHDWNSFVPGKL
jgi:hypothetical protein